MQHHRVECSLRIFHKPGFSVKVYKHLFVKRKHDQKHHAFPLSAASLLFLFKKKEKSFILKLICFEAPSFCVWNGGERLMPSVTFTEHLWHRLQWVKKKWKDENRRSHVLLLENWISTKGGLQTRPLLLSFVSPCANSFTGLTLGFLAFQWIQFASCLLLVVFRQHLSLLTTGMAVRLIFSQNCKQYSRKTFSLWIVSVKYGTCEHSYVSHATLTVSDRYGPRQWGWRGIYRRHSHMKHS